MYRINNKSSSDIFSSLRIYSEINLEALGNYLAILKLVLLLDRKARKNMEIFMVFHIDYRPNIFLYQNS